MDFSESLLGKERPQPALIHPQSIFDRLSWSVSFALTLLGFAMVFMGLFTDVTTIIAYFRNGDRDWGIIASVFTGLGWAFFIVSGARVWIAGSAPGLTSNLFKHTSYRMYGALTLLQLLPALLQLDAAASLWQHRHDKDKRDEAVGKPMAELNKLKAAESMLKTVPLLVLHSYILLVNQLGSAYVGKRFTGGVRLSQIGSLVSGVYFLAPAYISSLFTALNKCWLKQREVTGSWRKQLLTLYFAVDTAVRVLRIAVLTSCVHVWSAVGILCACFVLFLVSVPTHSWAGVLFARSSPVSSFFLFEGGEQSSPVERALTTLFRSLTQCRADNQTPFFLSGPPLLLFPVVDALLNAVMLSTPFVLPARPYVHLHGVCSPLSDVHAGNNCFPVPLVASVAALVLLHWALLAIVWQLLWKLALTIGHVTASYYCNLTPTWPLRDEGQQRIMFRSLFQES